MGARGKWCDMDGKPESGFSGRKHHKPRHGVVANTPDSLRNGAVGFIDWLGRLQVLAHYVNRPLLPNPRAKYCPT
jgi:hypothetical protein